MAMPTTTKAAMSTSQAYARVPRGGTTSRMKEGLVAVPREKEPGEHAGGPWCQPDGPPGAIPHTTKIRPHRLPG